MVEKSERTRTGADWLSRTAGVKTLDDTSIVELTGDDVREWIQGQVTNDLRTLAEGSAKYALVVNVKAKILADVWILDRGATFLVLLPAQSVDAVLESFEKQIIMEDVTLKKRDDLAVVTIQGPTAARVVEAIRQPNVGVFPCDRLGSGGVDVVSAFDNREAVVAEVAAACERENGGLVDDDAWELARVRAGRPRYGRDFDHEHYPQEAGLKHLAVSFTKGCYFGQEVICMIEARGKPPRRLVAFDAASSVAPGAKLRTEEGTEVGEVTSVVLEPIPSDHWTGFAYVKRALAEAGTRLVAGDEKTSIAVKNIVEPA